MWRGYVTRKWYRDLRQRVPPRDPSLRRRYFEEKFSVLTDHVVQSCECSTSGAERVLAEADTALADARGVMRWVDWVGGQWVVDSLRVDRFSAFVTNS